MTKEKNGLKNIDLARENADFERQINWMNEASTDTRKKGYVS